MLHHLSRGVSRAVWSGRAQKLQGRTSASAPGHLGRHCPPVASAAPAAEGGEGASPWDHVASWKNPDGRGFSLSSDLSLRALCLCPLHSRFPCACPPLSFNCWGWCGLDRYHLPQGWGMFGGIFISPWDPSLGRVLAFAHFALGRIPPSPAPGGMWDLSSP